MLLTAPGVRTPRAGYRIGSRARGAVCVVGITGGSASGKSELAHFLKRELGNLAAVICQDWYYRDYGHLPPEECEKINFDHPQAIESSLFLRHVDRLIRGKAVAAPRYDYATHGRGKETLAIESAPVLILEGLFILHERSLLKRLDVPVYIEVPDDVRLLRRVRRDCHQRRIDLAETLRLYESYVRPMHERFVSPSAARATWVWRQMEDGQGFPHALLAEIRERLRTANSLQDKAIF